jgi:hypothetical protein
MSRGWEESGFSRSAFTTSQSVREAAERFAQAERAYDHAVSSSHSAGATHEIDTPTIANAIAADRSLMTAFSNRVHMDGLAVEARDRGEQLIDRGFFPPDEQGQRAAYVAGGLKAMTMANATDSLRETLADFGVEYRGSTEADRFAGVGGSMGAGPQVDLSGGPTLGGYAGRGAAEPEWTPEGRHADHRQAVQDQLDAQVRPVVQQQLEDRRVEAEAGMEDRSFGERFWGGLNALGRSTVDGFLEIGSLNEALQARLEAYAGDARGLGATEAQARLYAFHRSNGGAIFGDNSEEQVQLERQVLEEYARFPNAGEAFVSRIEHAAHATDIEGDRLMTELGHWNQQFEEDVDGNTEGLFRRNARGE